VVVSALVPAMQGARIANPSGARRWSVPTTRGDDMVLEFPFILDRAQAMGMLAFLHEFFDANRDDTLGSFVTGWLRALEVQAHGGAAWVLQARVWLAPYDLGVGQLLAIYLYPTSTARVYKADVHLTRVSGQDSDWLRTNRPFLRELRHQLLVWRALSLERRRRFADDCPALLRKATEEKADN